MALGHLAIVEVDLGEDPQAADDPCNWIPIHLDEFALFGGCFGSGCCDGAHSILPSVRSRMISSGQLGARMTPLRFLVHGCLGDGAERRNGFSIDTGRTCRNLAAWRLVHERHELV